MSISIYTDGACSGNPGIGGWGAVIIIKNENPIYLNGGSDYTTNNSFLIPKSLMLDVRVSDNFLAELNYSKITANKVLKMVFSIPKNYVEIN